MFSVHIYTAILFKKKNGSIVFLVGSSTNIYDVLPFIDLRTTGLLDISVFKLFKINNGTSVLSSMLAFEGNIYIVSQNL